MKAYFGIAGLFDEVKFNTGKTVKLELKSIKVGGVEQLTAAFFSEIIPSFVDPHSGNAWEFASCTQTGTYPNSTSITSCSIGGIANSFNPFKDAFGLVYGSTVGGVDRGEITGTQTASVYGFENFLFGFDAIDIPVNDIVGGGSSGATKQGNFYLDVDFSQDFYMEMEVSLQDSLGNPIVDTTHTWFHNSVSCEFEYTKVDSPYTLEVSEDQIGAFGTNQFAKQLVDGNNGFMYSAPYNGDAIIKLNPLTNTFSGVGSFVSNGQRYQGGALASNGNIYYVPANETNVLKFEVSSETYTTVGSVAAGANKYVSAAITPTGIIYSGSLLYNKYLKVDTNTDTVTEVATASALGYSFYASNGFVYFFPQSSGGEIKKLDTSTDIITTVATDPIQTTDLRNDVFCVEINGYLYFGETSSGTTTTSNIYKLDLSNDNITSKGLGNNTANNYYSSAIVRNDIIYILPFFGKEVLSIDPYNNDAISSFFTLTGAATQPWFAFPCLSLTDNNIYTMPRANNIAQRNYISAIEWDYVQATGSSIDVTQLSFLSGGLNGWVAPACGGSGNVNDDPIVTQSIAILPKARQAPVTVFDNNVLKRCCYFSPVFASSTDTDNYKNDYNSFLFQRTYASDTIDFTLLKDGGVANGGTDIPLIDNTYGTLFNYGFLGSTNKKGYKVDWRNVLLLQGEGTYQIKTVTNTVQGISEEYSLVFKLREYSDQAVKGTVRIDSVMDGYLRNINFDYKGLTWLDSIRVRGFFGNRQAEYEQEQIIYANRQSRQLRSELINVYTMQTMHIPSCITDLIIEYHNFANVLYITDYNPVNHKKDYVRKQVVFDSMDEIDYKSVTDLAPLVVKYKDYIQNYTKSNC